VLSTTEQAPSALESVTARNRVRHPADVHREGERGAFFMGTAYSNKIPAGIGPFTLIQP
jgi:hypothetical protein